MNLLKIVNISHQRLPSKLRPQWKLWSRNCSGIAGKQPNLEFPGWSKLQERRIEEFDINATLLEHVKTKAKYLHMACEDSNNAFSVNFRTTPMDSTGVAHILEHTTLCGSQKFPVRDPFMKMLNRSLSTFMNAMTGPDYTLYPFSTCNEQDYYNLMSVYLDSVFKPLLREQDFLQEGWRLEHDDLADNTTPLVIKGVVYNEMKGAYANAQSLFGQQLLNNLYPSHTYSYSSGGFPLHIPNLTWENLKIFHAEHYHPSNARFLSYGNLPLENHLAKIDSEYLSKFDYLDLDTSVPPESRWSEPKRIDVTCAPDPMNPDPSKQSTLAVSYLMSDVTDIKHSFALQVVCELLTGGPGSPFYKSLIETGLGSNFSPVTGYEDHTKETNFTIGLQNIKREDTDKILHVIDKTIDGVIEDGFESDKIEAVLHSYELSLKHKSANFGMNLIMSMTPFWNHAENPIDFLQVNDTVYWFKEQLKNDPSFLKGLVKMYLKDNSHKLVQTMSPVDNYSDMEQKQFDALELKLREKLSDNEKELIHTKCLELQKMQDEKEDASCLPTLKVSDISSDYLGTSVDQLMICNTPVQVSVQPTNEVSYFRALIDTSSIPADLKPYLPIFTSVLTKMGASHLNYADLDTAVELRTGGLAATCHVQEDQDNLNKYVEAVLLSSHCLDKNIDKMFELWSMIFNDNHWDDTKRLSQLLKMSSTNTLNGIAQSGHRYAMTSAASTLNPASSISETFSGMSYVQLLSKLSQGDTSEVVNKLKMIATLVLSNNRMRCALNSSNTEGLLNGTENFLNTLGGENKNFAWGVKIDPVFSSKNDEFFTSSSCQKHYVTPFPINFTSLAIPTVSYTHPDYAPLRVLAAVLSSKFLHPEIREKGGAYGGGSMAGSGTFTFYSYRDPKNLETFSVYRKSGEWALENNFDQKDVDEAILRVFQSLDAPVTPGYKGIRQFLTGISDEVFANHRISVKNVKVQDLKVVSDRYLLDPAISGKAMIGGLQQGLEDLGWKVYNQ